MCSCAGDQGVGGTKWVLDVYDSTNLSTWSPGEVLWTIAYLKIRSRIENFMGYA